MDEKEERIELNPHPISKRAFFGQPTIHFAPLPPFCCIVHLFHLKNRKGLNRVWKLDNVSHHHKCLCVSFKVLILFGFGLQGAQRFVMKFGSASSTYCLN